MTHQKQIFENLEIEQQVKTGSIQLEQFMRTRLENMPTLDLSSTKSWTIKAQTKGEPSFIELSAEGKPDQYETLTPAHRIFTNLPVSSPRELEIYTSPIDGTQPTFAGYGITPLDGSLRRQRESMRDGEIAAVIAVEFEEGSRAIAVNIPAKAIKKEDTAKQNIVYGHPAQDGFVLRPYRLKRVSSSTEEEIWNDSLGIATVIADGNTSKEVRESDLARHPGVIMKKLKGGKTFQVLGQPEPFSHLALGHVSDLATFVDPRNHVASMAGELLNVHNSMESGAIPYLRGGTTATFSAQILPNERHDGFYRNYNFQPEPVPGGTNLGKSVLINSERGDITVEPTTLQSVMVSNLKRTDRSHFVVNDTKPSEVFSQPNWWDYLSVNDIFENQGLGIRIETTDGIVKIKDPERLKEILLTMSTAEIISILTKEEELIKIFELHAHDDITFIITQPGISREKESYVPNYLRSTLTLIRQAGQKYAKNTAEYSVIEELKAQSKALEAKILETIKQKLTDGTLAKLSTEFEVLTKRIHSLDIQHAIDEDLSKTLGSKEQRDIYLSHCAALDMAKQIDKRKGKNEDVSKALSVLFDIAENKLPIVVIPKELDIKMMREVFIELANLGILRLKKPEDFAKSLEILTNIRGTFKVRSLRKLLGTSALSLLKELGNYANTGESKELPKWRKETETLLETLELYIQQ